MVFVCACSYWTDPFNCFDGFLVYLILLEFILNSSVSAGIRVVRLVRLIRVLRTLRVFRFCRTFDSCLAFLTPSHLSRCHLDEAPLPEVEAGARASPTAFPSSSSASVTVSSSDASTSASAPSAVAGMVVQLPAFTGTANSSAPSRG